MILSFGKQIKNEITLRQNEYRKKKAFLWGELERRGFSREQIESIHLPIGLDIGGETPAEIAVSVTAQLIQVRAGRLGRSGGGLCPA